MTRISDVSACFSLCTSQEPPLSCSSAQRLFHRLGRAMPCLALLHTSSKYVADRHFGGLQSEHKHKYVDPPPSESSFHHPEPKTTTTTTTTTLPTNTTTIYSTLPLYTSLPASPSTQHNGRHHLRGVQHGIAKPPTLPWPTTNPPSASCSIQIDIDMNINSHVCLARLTHTWLWRTTTSISTPHPYPNIHRTPP